MDSILEIRRNAHRVLLGAVLALIALPACANEGAAQAAAPQQGGGNQVVATVDGEQITLSELEQQSSEQLQSVEAQLAQCQRQVEQSRFQALDSSLRGMVRERLLAAEAQKAGQSVEDYRAAELESRIQPVTDADVAAFYEENKARIGNRTLEQVAAQIRPFIEQQRRTEAENAFFADLERKHQVTYRLEPPRTQVAAEGPSVGPANAPVTIVEFSDFECPFCSRVVPTINQVKEEYGDKVRIVFRQFPLNIHPNAQKAAEASLCAEEQGKFWEMHDAMFADQRNLGVASLKTMAAGIEGLNTETFNQCLDSGQFAGQVQADMEAGLQAGVTGTPAMFVNGIPVSGAVPFEQLAQVIDQELQRKGISTEN
ncbi:MAG TPA: thioredoxin domain-containing protein [Thermoanaerobaculia bacterium]|nr:thioredoxin domain-containing protein [Thermoanaerobaculia bacterium]